MYSCNVHVIANIYLGSLYEADRYATCVFYPFDIDREILLSNLLMKMWWKCGHCQVRGLLVVRTKKCRDELEMDRIWLVWGSSSIRSLGSKACSNLPLTWSVMNYRLSFDLPKAGSTSGKPFPRLTSACLHFATQSVRVRTIKMERNYKVRRKSWKVPNLLQSNPM